MIIGIIRVVALTTAFFIGALSLGNSDFIWKHINHE